MLLALLTSRLVLGLFSCDYQHARQDYIRDTEGDILGTSWKPKSCPDYNEKYCGVLGGVCSSQNSTSCTATNSFRPPDEITGGGDQPCDTHFVWQSDSGDGGTLRLGNRICKHGYGFPLPTDGQFTLDYQWAFLNANEGLQTATIDPKCTLMCHCNTCELHRVYSPNASLGSLNIEPAFTDYYFGSVNMDLDQDANGDYSRSYQRWTSPTAEAAWSNGSYQHWGAKEPYYTGEYLKSLLLAEEIRQAHDDTNVGKPDIDNFQVVCTSCTNPTELPENDCKGPTHKEHEGEDFHVFLSCAKHATEKDCNEDVYTTWNGVVNHTADPNKKKRCEWVESPFSVIKATENIPMDRFAFQGGSLGDKSPLHFQVTLDVGDNKEAVKLHTDQHCSFEKWLGSEATAADCMFKILRTDNCSHDFFNYASESGGDRDCGCASNLTDCSGGALVPQLNVDVYSIELMATKIAEQNNGQCKAVDQDLPHLVPFTAVKMRSAFYPNQKNIDLGGEGKLVSSNAIPKHSIITLKDSNGTAYDYTVVGDDIDATAYWLEAAGDGHFAADGYYGHLTVSVEFADSSKAVYDCKDPNLPLFMQMNLQGYPANTTQGVIACVKDADLFEVRNAFQWIHMHEEIKEVPLSRNIAVVVNNAIATVAVSNSSVLHSVNVATHACPRSLREVVILSSTTVDVDDNKVGLFRACVPVTCYNSTIDEGKPQDDLEYICQATPRCEARPVSPYALQSGQQFFNVQQEVEIGLCMPDFYKIEELTEIFNLTQSEWKYNDRDVTPTNVSDVKENVTSFETVKFEVDTTDVFFFRQIDSILFDVWDVSTPPAANNARTTTAKLELLSTSSETTEYYDLTQGNPWLFGVFNKNFRYYPSSGPTMFLLEEDGTYWIATPNHHWKVYNSNNEPTTVGHTADKTFYTSPDGKTLQEYNSGTDTITTTKNMNSVQNLMKLYFVHGLYGHNKGFVSQSTLTSNQGHMDECHRTEIYPLQNNKDDRRHLAPFPNKEHGLFFRSVDERYVLGYNATAEPPYYNLAMCISFGEVDCKSRLSSDISQERFPCPKSNTEYQSIKCEDLNANRQGDDTPQCYSWQHFHPLDSYPTNYQGAQLTAPYISECTSFCGTEDECGNYGNYKNKFVCAATAQLLDCHDANQCASCGNNVELLDPTKECPAQSTLPSTVTTTTVTTSTATTTTLKVTDCGASSSCGVCSTCTSDSNCNSTLVCRSYNDSLNSCGENATHSSSDVCVVETTSTTTLTLTTTTMTTTTTTTNTTTTKTPFIGDCCDTKNHRILQGSVESCGNNTAEHVKHVKVGTCREGDWGGRAEWILIPLVGPLVVIGVAWAVAQATAEETGRIVRAASSIAYTLVVIASVALQWHANNEDSRDVIVIVRVLLFVVAATAIIVQGALRNNPKAEPLLPELGIDGGTVLDKLLSFVFKYFHAATAWLAYGIAARMVYREIDTNKLLVEVVGDDVRVPLLVIAIGLGLQAVPIRTLQGMEGGNQAALLKGANAGVMILFLASSFYSFATILDHPVTSENFAAIIATVAAWGFYSILVPTIDHEGQWFLKSELLLRIVGTVLILVGGILLHREIDRTHIDYSAFQTYLETDQFLVAAFMLALVYSSFVILMDVVILLYTAFSGGEKTPKYTQIDSGGYF